MEQIKARVRMAGSMRNMRDHAVIMNRRFLDDEQLIRSEQLAVLEEIFNANVRDREMREISCHFAPVLRRDHPYHLALWGKQQNIKTLSRQFHSKRFTHMGKRIGG